MPKKAEKKESTLETTNEQVDVKVTNEETTEIVTEIQEETITTEKAESTEEKVDLSKFDWHNYEEGIDQVDDK